MSVSQAANRDTGGGDVLADMVCQFRVRTCANRTRATGTRVRRRLFERAIDAGARDPRQTITASKGPFPSTPEGAPAPALGGALRRPFGLAPIIIRHG